MKNPFKKFEKPEAHVQMNREMFLVVGLATLTVFLGRKLNKELNKR